MTRCSICNRPLTDAESIEIGIGPICRMKLGSVSQMTLDFDGVPEKFRGLTLKEQHDLVWKIISGKGA